MSPNEKEISHERGPWQAPSSSFDQGPLGFIDWLDVCVTTLELLLYMFERLPRVPLLHPAPPFQAAITPLTRREYTSHQNGMDKCNREEF